MTGEFQVMGQNAAALFTLKLHRGDGMTLVAMNWKVGEPPNDFVGFAIQYKEPGGDKFYALKNRIGFPGTDATVNPNALSTRLSPIQKFRWVHFPRNAEMNGEFVYEVTPVFMNATGEFSYGEPQQAAIELRRETFPGKLNVAFTRGFVSSQAFVDRYGSAGPISTLLPPNADAGLDFVPTHPKAKEALAWMGFEARSAIIELLDQAIANADAKVRVVAYDLSEAEFVKRLKKLGKRLKIIIDNSDKHGEPGSAESEAARRLQKTAGAANVKRQKMGGLQHNKTIVVDGPTIKAAVCGSTNFTWRGFFVQSNNAVVVQGKRAIAPFIRSFDDYWNNDKASDFGLTASAAMTDLGLKNINAKIVFSPHAAANAVLNTVADDIANNTESSLFYSLAFLYQTPGVILNAINKVTNDDKIFVYGISDKKVGGIVLLKPDGNKAPVNPAALEKNLPEPFKSEPTGGGGTRLHHKFLVIDFDKPTARVYFGSYNFSVAADVKNGENLVLIRDRRIAVSYMIEALRIFDHYHFRVAQAEAKKARKKLLLAKPPSNAGEKPWWRDDYQNAVKIRDRELFS
ncbi:MAG TPA: phospholipase D-like domain-containing protein [Pyrinomonadaceae bacterium]|nr:phospholipase D-like domain-containing protein [Pyrinomonadaceae bacterium]